MVLFLLPCEIVNTRAKYLLAVLLLSGLAASYWLVGLCYSRGYDFFLWVYNAWVARQQLSAGGWPAWTMYAAAGQPVFKISGVADALVLGSLSGLFGPSASTQVMTVGLYLLAGWGMFTLAYYLVRSAPGALVAAVAYVFSWFLTYTAYYQAYLNNLLSYALLPWCAWLFVRAVRTGERWLLLGAAGLLCASILSNAQVSLKVVLFVVPLGLAFGVLPGWARLKTWVGASIAVVGFALWWSCFLIAPALHLSQEVVVPGELRGNAFIPPWMVLFWVPLFGLNFLWFKLGGASFLDRDVLAWVIFSDYPGLSVAAIALCALAYYRVEQDTRLLALGAMLAGYWLIYFGLVPFLPASSWVGRTHNWALLPTLVLALASAYGSVWLIGRLHLRLAAWQVSALLCGLMIVDLGGVSFFLNRLAITHTPLEQLPEVRAWKQVEASLPERGGESRWFTFNPDHTHYLLPVMAGRPTANVIDLRARTWEYDSYLEHQLRSMRQVDPTYRAGESLGLLNVELIDLPSKLFALRGSDPDLFAAAVDHLKADPHLGLVFTRGSEPEDRIYDGYDPELQLEQITAPGLAEDQLAQVIFANQRHRPGFIPEYTVLLLGNTRDGERFFESLTHLDAYRFDRVLYLLAEQFEAVDRRVISSLSGCIPVSGGQAPPGLAAWDLDRLQAIYRSPPPAPRPLQVQLAGEQGMRAELSPSPQPVFALLSIQRFADWHARDTSGEELPAYKAGAGLTALWIPPDTEALSYRYETPRYELGARLFSALGVLVALAWARAGKGTRGGLGESASFRAGFSSRWRISKRPRYIKESNV